MITKLSPLPVAASSVAITNVTKTAPQTRAARYFFVAMACLFPVIVLLGFGSEYRDMTTGELKPHWLVHVHGAVMAGWILVFLAQAVLAARGYLKFHRQLGLLSVGLGVLVWLGMGMVTVHMLIANHPPEGHWFFDLCSAAVFLMAMFGVFFTWGILARKKDPAAHKRLLMLATLVTLQAAVDRIHWLPLLGIGYPYVFMMYLDLMLIPLFLYDFVTLRRIHRITWSGLAIIVASQLSISALWGSPALHKFWFNLTAPLMEKVVEIKLGDAQTDPLLGEYKSESFGKMTVSREGGRLHLQFTGQEKQEMGAINETRFFLRSDIGQYSFVKDARGAVTKAVLQLESETQEMPKMEQP